MIAQVPMADGEIVRMLLAGANGAKASPPGGGQAEAVDYDWTVPRRYNAAQLQKLGDFSDEAAGAISTALADLLSEEIELAPAGLTQQYAGSLVESAGGQDIFFVDLVDADGKACGLVTLPAATAVDWVARLLGSAEESGRDRELSPLETELLVDAVAAVTSAFSSAGEAAGGNAFANGQKVSKGPIAPPGDDTADYCVLSYNIGSGGQARLSFIVESERLDALAGAGGKQSHLTPEQTRQYMREHVGGAMVAPALQLGSARATLREVMALQPGDVMILQRRVDEPVELTVQGQLAMRGHLAACEGKYAVKISSWAPAAGQADQSAPPAGRAITRSAGKE